MKRPLSTPIGTRTTLKIAAILFSTASLLGCDGGAEENLGGTPTPPADTSHTGNGGVIGKQPVILEKPLYMRIESAWTDEPENFEKIAECVVPEGSPVGTVVNCTGAQDEGRLYFSNLRLTVGAAPTAACPILIFRPYYYKKFPNVPAATCPFDTWILTDSTPNPAVGDCYDGPATTILPEFTSGIRGIYFLTNSVRQSEYSVKSAESLRKDNNRWTVNNLVDHTTGFPGYVGNSMKDYVLECRDKYYDLQFQINYVMHDNDGLFDHFSNWQ